MRKYAPAPALLAIAAISTSVARDEPSSPRAVASWPSGPLEVRVAFDRPLDPGAAKSVANGSIPFAERNAAVGGKPPTPLGTLKVAAALLDDDNRTLVLATDPHPFNAAFSPSLPGLPAPPPYTLGGVQVEFEGADAEKPAWPGSFWWPGLDADGVRDLARGSAEHERFFALLKTPGRLTLRTVLALPKGKVTVRLATSGGLEEPSLGGEVADVKAEGGETSVDLAIESTGDPVELAFDVRTSATGKPFGLRASYRAEGEATARPIPRELLSLPWAPPAPPRPADVPPLPPQMARGDPKRGEAVFFGDVSKCSTCHAMKGRGGVVGPDLSEQHKEDVAMVYRDILEPSAAIRPDYVPYVVTTRSGRVLAGVVRSEGPDAIQVIGTDAQAVLVKRPEVEEIRPSATSIMPVGLPGAIGEAGMRDLLAYLMTRDGKRD